MKVAVPREPDFETARSWWPDLPNIWTPVGWKDHLFRFNVFWSGLILAQPDLNRRTQEYAGEGAQVTIYPAWRLKPSADTGVTLNVQQAVDFAWHDDGLVTQGWLDGAAPVLWSEIGLDGVKLRQYVFAHVPGGKPVETGTEPLFAWVRVEIHELCDGLPHDDRYGFLLRLNAPHIRGRMSLRRNVCFEVERSRYPRELRPAAPGYDPAAGWRLLEPDGRVRLGVAPGQDCTLQVLPQQPDRINGLPPRRTGLGEAERASAAPSHLDLYFVMPCKRGQHVELLLPMLPADRETFDRELALGRVAALKETESFWSAAPNTAAHVCVPEAEVNETIRHSVKFSEILAERNPDTGKYCKINGSFVYADLWTTPGAMDLVMMMDALGRHDVVAKYLEIFREEQGTVTPPGDAYACHPGYLSTPALYKSIDWLADHGAVLYTLAMHGLLSGDRAWAEHFADTLVKACDWVRYARGLTGHGGVEGLPPAAVTTDRKTCIQATWSLGWIYKGMITAIRLLRRIGHPRTEEFAAEAQDYREAFRRAYRSACRKAPRWTGPDGRRHCLPPTSLAGDANEETRHPFYLDTGPLFLVFSGLLDADDPAMEAARLWFREGPPRRFYRHDANYTQIGALEHEMSSAEPCYSWNVFHSWQQGDRQHFLEGMYSLFAGAVSRKTFISCETRGGITGNVFAAPLAIWLARLAMIDDEIEEGVLHLLRLMPQAWLKPGDCTEFSHMPTGYGPVTLRTKMSSCGTELQVDFVPRFPGKVPAVILHVPEGISTLVVNGKKRAPEADVLLS
jgi:hypothetical protein